MMLMDTVIQFKWRVREAHSVSLGSPVTLSLILQGSGWSHRICYNQACKFKFRLKDLTSCLCSAASPAFCFKDRVAGVNATETGNELSQPTLEFTSLVICHGFTHQDRIFRNEA